MGKEQDLLQAAKTGNVAHIEKILGHKTRKSGIQSLMSKTVNPNHQDELGYTPLHYAALNGHRSSAELLLKYDTSTNIPDNSGNYPLHLAAWNGHADVAKVLINTGPSRANVNEQNGTEDTALHSASQFGQSLVVAVLLENHADPYIRNSRQESPLDLAAQYGRMETVKQLLNYHPNLLEDMNVVRTHTPLHLAARNGHMNVVSYFLSCGMDVNIACTSGTALHEAALFGKADVVNLLLQCGIDVTVVDSDNKTVLDLLAKHPSAKTREIKDLIYASSLKEPVSSLKRQHTVFQSGVMYSRTSNTFPGLSDRPKSAMYSRNLSYDSVPSHQVFDPDLLRRSGTYDSVPAPRTRQESLKQSSYDTVPPPKATPDRSHSLDWTKYDEVESRSPNSVHLSHAGKGYALLGPAEEPTTGTPPMLSPHEITKGYSLLGSPTQSRAAANATNARCLVRPDSTYAEVRNEGENFVPTRISLPSQTAFNDYSLLGFPSTGEESEPMPISGMVSEDNAGYFMVGEPNQQLSQSQRQNNDSYDFVGPPQGPRTGSQHQPSIYEVPSLSLRGKGNGQEGDDTPSRVPSRTSRGQSFDMYENTNIGAQQQVNQPLKQDTSYDFVTLPPRKATLDQPSYDMVPPPSRISQEQRVSAEPPASSATSARAQGDIPCPLDIQGYEFVQLRKPSPLASDSTPEMQPFAPVAGYEPMGPPTDVGYEILAPPADLQEQIDKRGDYETLAMVGPQRTGSQTGSMQMNQQPSGSMNIPVTAPLYEVPPIMSSPLYEIAPPPRDVPPLPPRPAPAAPVAQAPSQAPSSGEVQWIEKEQEESLPKVPPRRLNEYSDWHPGMRQEPPPPGRPPKSGAYEQVRLEGPTEKGTIDWERVRRLNARGSGGDYCTLSATAVGPGETKNRESTTSSEMSFMSEPALTPPFSPPSPSTAEASVFAAFGSLQPSDMATIPEVPEEVKDEPQPPRPMPRKSKPKVLPRSDSLHDEEYAPKRGDSKKDESGTDSFERNQDPFSFPLAASPSPTLESPKNSDFAELHKRFSPCNSREDIFTYANASPGRERQAPDGAEAESEVKPSPLIYENVLFKRSDDADNGQTSQPRENGGVVKRGDSTERPESYRLSTLSADSPMDEREEWEKIEAFLSSIGQIEVPQTLEQQIVDAGKADTVPGWLKALDLGQYESSMMANGFDDINFLNGVLEDDDLLDIGIVDFNHRRTIMEALKSLPASPRLSDPALTEPESLKDWLELLCLSEYFDVFQHNGFTSMERIHMLWEVELTSVLEVNSLGHRKRILASLKEDVKEPDRKEQPDVPNLDESSTDLEVKLAELKMYCPDEKPPTKPTEAVASAEDLMAAAEEMMSGSKEMPEEKPKPKPRRSKKWKHESSVLIKGNVNYTTLYLGSHAVKTITGLESTIDACRKMRLSTAKLQKIPSVTLSVSVKGIKFIDARSKLMVSYHDMKNISYITQDPEDRKVFAYIAKDAKTEKHYCHVFKMESTALSDEVTMTIGQAFELAFSQFVQARK